MMFIEPRGTISQQLGRRHEDRRFPVLTDIFARRYAHVSRLIVQAFRIVSEQICPYQSPAGKADWKTVHDRISMELGKQSLSPVAYSYQATWNGNPHTVSGVWTIEYRVMLPESVS
jgi:hypothetical protein